jgi:glycosyltransferase involved in cell wall biosynthesis
MSSTNELRFSVVIPAYNEEQYIGTTLKTLQKQDFEGAYEVIVVDNNCSDNTVSIAHSLGARVISENHAGVCWARQAGTEAALGEIIISTDADTVFDSDWLKNIDKQFHKNPHIVAVCAPCSFIDPPWWGVVYPKLLFGTVYIFYKIFKRPFYITATNTAFRKSAWDGYDMELTQGGDEIALLHKLCRRGHVRFTKRYVVHTSSRRLNHGLWYNLFVTFLFYYLAAYYINMIFKRQIIGTAPAYRQHSLAKRGTEMATRIARAMTSKEAWPAVLTTRSYKLSRHVSRDITEKD